MKMITATPTPAVPRPKFGPRHLRDLLKLGQEGYSWTQGIHVYSELRPVERFKVAETEAASQRFLQVVEDYTHAGIQAAVLFDITLLEVQGTVLHFHLEGALDRDAFKRAMSFSYVFSKVLYEGLAEDMRAEWNGFAICMDHGPAIIVRHGQASNSSAISLSDAANRPAKRLFYGRTESGHVEYPEVWHGQKSEGWAAINLRDRNSAPMLRDYENAEIEARLRQILQEYRQKRKGAIIAGIPIVQVNDMVDQGGYTADHPLRVQAFCMRADLDGFSKKVKAAFQQGEEAVEAVAVGFVRIMQFGDFFEKQHLGAIRLPWAGDCATFLFPPDTNLSAFRGKNWIEIVEQWQTFASGTDEGRKQRWSKVFADVSWAIGMTYADNGHCLVAPIQALERKFLIGAGAPLTIAQDAQNTGKGEETVILSSDHQALYNPVRKLFQKIEGTDFWCGRKITMDKAAQAIVEAGKTENVQTFADKAATLTYPQPRPYCR